MLVHCVGRAKLDIIYRVEALQYTILEKFVYIRVRCLCRIKKAYEWIIN